MISKTMKTGLRLTVVAMSITLLSCGQIDSSIYVDEGKIEGRVYTSEEIGWTVQIPRGWKILEKNKVRAAENKGAAALGEVVDNKVDMNKGRNLISFQKGRFNIFLSTSQPYDLRYEVEWKKGKKMRNEIMAEFYAKEGIKIDTSSSRETIDGLEFEVYHITIYKPNGAILLYQDMYGRYIKGFDFSVIIHYEDKKYKKKMMEVWKNSKFKK